MRNEIKSGYFEWLLTTACERRYSHDISYRKLLTRLHHTRFKYVMGRDKNQAVHGIGLRRRFALQHAEELYDSIMDILVGPCSVLEMMVALAIRCEEDIMDDPRVGNRVSQWFWGMIVSLGLGSMQDSRYDEEYVDRTITRFLNRDYEPNGKGGLFTIENCDVDLRNVEIWCQLCWYLDCIT